MASAKHIWVLTALAVGLAPAALAAGKTKKAASPIAYLEQMAKLDDDIKLLRKKQEHDNAKEGSVGRAHNLPKILAIYGAGSQLSAEVLYENGLIMRCEKGDTIPGDFTVAHIGHNGVTVRFGNARMGLEYSPTLTGQRGIVMPAPLSAPVVPASPLPPAVPSLPAVLPPPVI